MNDTLRYLPASEARLQYLYTQKFLSYLSVGLLTTLFLYRYLVLKDEKGTIRKLGGFSIFTAWKFLNKRYDFILEIFGSDPTSHHFKFNIFRVLLSPLSLYHWSRTDY